MRHCINAASGQLLAMTAAVECITLSLKLQRMLERWSIYLPFHECIDVKFEVWIEKLSKIHRGLNNIQTEQREAPDYLFYPDTPFCIDFADLLEDIAPETDETSEEGIRNGGESQRLFVPRYASTELQNDVKEYVERFKDMLERMNSLSEEDEDEWHSRIDRESMRFLRRQYTDYLRFVLTNRNQQTPREFEENILPLVRNYLKTVVDQPSMAYCLDMALSTLIDNLRQVNGIFSQGEITSERLRRLSLRLYHRHYPDAQHIVEIEAHRWIIEWPKRKCQERARQKREQIIAHLHQRYDQYDFCSYVDIGCPSPLVDSEFGRFLFANRHHLEIEDVVNLFHDCFRIQQLNHIIDPTAAEADLNAMRLNRQRRQIYERLKELINLARWQNGMTADIILRGFAELLLPQPDLTPSAFTPQNSKDKISAEELSAASEKLWDLLVKRRGCEESARSLKLTWLNLVGYFRNRGVLKGGSPALCRQFFPEENLEDTHHDTDYNAISKGGDHRAPNDFQEIRPVLDKLFGLKEP